MHIEKAATLADAANGAVEYAWATGDTNLPPAEYDAEFEVVFASGEVQTFPTEGYLPVEIINDLGGTV